MGVLLVVVQPRSEYINGVGRTQRAARPTAIGIRALIQKRSESGGIDRVTVDK